MQNIMIVPDRYEARIEMKKFKQPPPTGNGDSKLTRRGGSTVATTGGATTSLRPPK